MQYVQFTPNPAINDIFSAFIPAPVPHPSQMGQCKAQNIPKVTEEVKTMNTNLPNTELVQREYLRTRLQNSRYAKEVDLRRHFGLEDDEAPQTFKEYIERIKTGKFVEVKRKVLDDEYDYEDEDGDYFDTYNPTRHLRWRDPAKKEDKKGFKIALEKTEAAALKVQGKVMVLEMDKALKALEEFEDAKIH